ncbi:MAG: hypothetical protein AAF430_17890 [Myxococcota bacterium]
MLMDHLPTLANLAEVLGAVTILGGAIFAIIQIREVRAQRRETVTIELSRAFQSPALIEAIERIRDLPDHVSAEDLRARGPEYERLAIMITTHYETIGFMVFRRVASYEIVRELTGGLAVVMFRKLDRWLDTVRAEQNQSSWGEWYHWLAEQLMKDGEHKEANPAYERYADWRPSGP